MTSEVLRPLSREESLRVQLLEQRMATLEAQQATLAVTEQVIRRDFGLAPNEWWQVDPDTGKLAIFRRPEPEPDPAPEPAADKPEEA